MCKRLLIAAIAAAYGAFCGSIPAAHALNTDLVIGLCSTCVTTNDFETAAWSLISSQTAVKWPGNYNQMTYTVIMSNTKASTAFLKLSGHWGVASRRPPTFDANTFTPVDASGNSIASQSEAYLESYYTQVDWTFYGIFRSDPLSVTLQGASATNFIGTPDTAISINISIAMDNQHTDPPAGSLIRVIFNDRTIAFYTRTTEISAVNKNKWYVWANVANYEKSKCVPVPGSGTKAICGGPIDRNGNIIINLNTSGKTSGGANPIPLYTVTPTPIPGTSTLYCTFSSYATDPDGNTVGSTGYGPC